MLLAGWADKLRTFFIWIIRLKNKGEIYFKRKTKLIAISFLLSVITFRKYNDKIKKKETLNNLHRFLLLF